MQLTGCRTEVRQIGIDAHGGGNQRRDRLQPSGVPVESQEMRIHRTERLVETYADLGAGGGGRGWRVRRCGRRRCVRRRRGAGRRCRRRRHGHRCLRHRGGGRVATVAAPRHGERHKHRGHPPEASRNSSAAFQRVSRNLEHKEHDSEYPEGPGFHSPGSNDGTHACGARTWQISCRGVQQFQQSTAGVSEPRVPQRTPT